MNKKLLMIVGILVGGMNMPLNAVKKMIAVPRTLGIDLAGQVQPPNGLNWMILRYIRRKPLQN